MFPVTRLRRLRMNEHLRSLVAESAISIDKLVMPIFVDENMEGRTEIASMPHIFRYGLNELPEYIEHLNDIGIKAVLLFGIPKSKDSTGSASYDSEGVVQKAIKTIKQRYKGIVIADLCLCEYTDHGHCGIVARDVVENDSTLDIYNKIAVSYAHAGVDMIAPSGMMDGQVKSIRSALDKENYHSLPIMSYSAKYASSLFAPFRDAAGSTPLAGDRKNHQMDPRNIKEALREIEQDINEGADIVMVKPALFYLDVIAKAVESFNIPLAAYSVSAEYSMLQREVDSGRLPEASIREYLNSIFRAGADIVITYFAEQMASQVSEK